MGFYSNAKVIVKPLSKIFIWTKDSGAENFPKTGPVILCMNHKSNLDPFIAGLFVPRELHFMAKAELFKIPLFNSLIKLLGAFPVERGKGDNEAINKANKILENGDVLAMYPEGHRLKQGEIPQRFKTGAAKLAYISKAVVIPAVILCKGKVRPFKKNQFILGKPLTYEQLGFTDGSYDNLKEVSAKIREKVIELLKN